VNREKYDRLILLKVEENFDRIIPLGGIACWISSLVIWIGNIPNHFAFYNLGFGVVFFLLTIFNKKLRIEIKIFIILSVALSLAALFFLDGGFNSGGIVILLLCNLLAVMFLPRKQSIFVSSVTVLLFIAIWTYMVRNTDYVPRYSGNSVWIIQFVLYSLFILVLHVSVHAIKDYLMLNIAELEESSKKTNDLAYVDQLTRLPNQNYFRSFLESERVRNSMNGFIVFFNIKNLNLINTIYGEDIGDCVVVEIAHVLLKHKKESDVIARMNGNEFVLWREIEGEEELVIWIHYVRHIFLNEFFPKEIETSLEFYISYSNYRSDTTTIEECYQNTRLALTYAKQNNLSYIIAYNKSFEEKIRKDQKLIDLLRNAIKKDEFFMMYQPKVDATKNEIIGVEALVRWNNNSPYCVGPAIFMGIIEKMNWSIEFGNLVIEKVFADYPEICLKYSKELEISINLSPSQIMTKDFFDQLKRMLENSQVPAEKLILEITEETLIQGIEEVNRVLNRFKKLGIRIALDDFGTGYSSYNYLMELDVNEVKIDRQFIKKLNSNEKANIILESIIHIADHYGMTVVAEGVETLEQLEAIQQMGCSIIQGYYFYRPEPLGSMVRRLQSF